MPQAKSTLELVISLRDLLRRLGLKLVLVESCTAGRICAEISCVPGISEWFCGGFVVYRSTSKTQWLSVSESVLNDPQHGAVSPLASRLLCESALRLTSEANVCMAITGDVGPGAKAETDGFCFVSIQISRSGTPADYQFQLTIPAPVSITDYHARQARLCEATARALELLIDELHKIE